MLIRGEIDRNLQGAVVRSAVPAASVPTLLLGGLLLLIGP
jgi:hypothetical protein